MFQRFDATTRPEDGPPRLAALRAKMAEDEIDAFIVPRADVHQGEYVAPCDERLAWLTGFTGSAGFAVVTAKDAGVFVDGRYTLQVRAQVDTDHFTPVAWPKTKLAEWLKERLEPEAVVAFDALLHTVDAATQLADALEEAGIETSPWDNLIDAIWEDRPPRPAEPLTPYPTDLAGQPTEEKIANAAKALADAGQSAAVLTLPDSIAWLLNMRGNDIPRMPIAHAFAVLHADARVDLFTDGPVDDAMRAHFGDRVTLYPYDGLLDHFETLTGKVRVDRTSAPLDVWARLAGLQALKDDAVQPVAGEDPCILPKARKSEAEIAATSEAHLRDGAAMVEFLAWLDKTAPQGGLTEIDVVSKLEGFRRATNALHDISFETICGAGPNGAIVHYRVTEDTNRTITPGELVLVDSGGQYLDGTTDITRTISTGEATDEQRAAFTRVLQGMIAISRARWPRGLAGRDLDPLARAPLWMAGQDYDHGTGHGVGVYLGVHEGPQRISRVSDLALEPGMILSNEPGYYKEGGFGIRIENLVVVEEAAPLGDKRDQLSFMTLTRVPIDTRLVVPEMLAPGERDWLNAYHADVLARIGPRVSGDTLAWLEQATAAI